MLIFHYKQEKAILFSQQYFFLENSLEGKDINNVHKNFMLTKEQKMKELYQRIIFFSLLCHTVM